ncbi:IS256 family transposase [Fodinibius halophilus]|uniref:Mutator family transposase n=1 Tax=Fodinibius halophilus TaxID=1736908 RepID=A0A6M1T4F3_9BACT|nr:IS256 family transposase [Fodinibius halophilus]NGP90286.1 IS256 family transposase [Fodinibius halophilus]
MNKKVKPSQRLSKRIQQLTSGQTEADDLLAELVDLGAQKNLQEGLEAEVDEFLGRGWHEHSGDTDPKGYRNGYTPKSFKTRSGQLSVQRPRVRDNEQPFESKLLERLDNIEGRLKTLAVEMYTRGLSTRDVEAALTEPGGEQLISRSGASRMSDALYEEYERWATQDLSGYDVIYLFADGVYESIRSISGGQTILCVWGICSDGRKVLLGLEAIASESAVCWEAHFDDLIDRGMPQPLFVISDGGKGLKAALTKCFPYATRGRCIAHKMRNLMGKLPRDEQIRGPIKRKIRAVYYAPDRATADQLAAGLTEAYAGEHPNMIKCFQADLEACLAHLEFPAGHRRYIRTTNLIERAFVEQKRRTKVIPNHINEKGAMKLVYGSLIRAARDWQRVSMDELELAQLKNLRKTMIPDEETITQNNKISYQLAA